MARAPDHFPELAILRTVDSKQSAINRRYVNLAVVMSTSREIRASRNEALQIRLRRSVAAPMPHP